MVIRPRKFNPVLIDSIHSVAFSLIFGMYDEEMRRDMYLYRYIFLNDFWDLNFYHVQSS
jgi:hypothetical protein